MSIDPNFEKITHVLIEKYSENPENFKNIFQACFSKNSVDSFIRDFHAKVIGLQKSPDFQGKEVEKLLSIAHAIYDVQECLPDKEGNLIHLLNCSLNHLSSMQKRCLGKKQGIRPLSPMSDSAEHTIFQSQMFTQAILEENPSLAKEFLVQQKLNFSQWKENQTTPWSANQKEIIAWLTQISLHQNPIPENLKAFASPDGIGMGYKAANLLILDQQAKSVASRLSSCDVVVPDTFELCHIEIKFHLQKHAPEIFSEWKMFQELLKQQDNVEISSCTVTKEAQDILQKIGTRIEQVFQDHPLTSPSILEWAQKHQGDLLIVRSTGMEDSDDLSNAGGNESIPFVQPEIHNMNRAIGQVVCSYFIDPSTREPRSIRQRLAAADPSVIDGEAFMPVLLQKMCMETEGTDSPGLRSGVLFTQPFPEHPDLLVIQTGYGNNHGIVSSQVPVDTYIVDSNRDVFKVIREKSSKFIHKQTELKDYTLEKVMVSPLESRKVAITDDVVRDLARVATSIATVYGKDGAKKSMDMEYSVTFAGKKPTIHLFQARPLVETHKKETPEPSFLDIASKRNSSQFVLGKTLLDGNSWVRECTSEKQILLARDLPYALDRYLKNPYTIQAVVVNQSAPLTSHEAVVLRSLGVCVVVVTDPQEFANTEKMVHQAQENTPVFVCPQRGMIVLSQDLQEAGSLKQAGRVRFPFPLETSVEVPKALDIAIASLDPESEETSGQELVSFVKELDARYREIHQRLGKDSQIQDRSISRLIDHIATGTQEEAIQAISQLIEKLHSIVFSRVHAPEKNVSHKLAMYEMLAVFSNVLDEVQQRVIPSCSFQAGSLKRLFGLKRLEALIFQPVDPSIVNSMSFQGAHLIEKASQELKGSDLEIAMKSFGYSIIRKDFQDKWNMFVEDLHQASLHLASNVYEEMKILQKTGNLVSWLNSLVSKYDPQRQDPIGFATQIIDVIQDNMQVLTWVDQVHQQVTTWHKSTDVWKTSKISSKQVQQLRIETKEIFQGFIENMRVSTFLGQHSLLHEMKDVVNTYDGIIKALKENPQFSSDHNKLVIFADLLEGYLELMEDLFSVVSVDLQQDLMFCRFENADVETFTSYMEKIHQGHEYSYTYHRKEQSIGFDDLVEKIQRKTLENPSQQFLARGSFSVNPMMIGSKVDRNYATHWPTTLEEYFTLFHQNSLKVLDAMSPQNDGLQVLPDRIQDFCNKMTSCLEIQQPSVSIQYGQQGEVLIEYNIPLNQHAAKIHLSYNPKSYHSVSMQFESFGANENERWYQVTALLSLMSLKNNGAYLKDMPHIQYGKEQGFCINLVIDAASDFKDCFEQVFPYIFQNIAKDGVLNQDLLDKSLFFNDVDAIPFQESQSYISVWNTIFSQLIEDQNLERLSDYIKSWISNSTAPFSIALVLNKNDGNFFSIPSVGGVSLEAVKNCLSIDLILKNSDTQELSGMSVAGGDIEHPIVSLLYCACYLKKMDTLDSDTYLKLLDKLSNQCQQAVEEQFGIEQSKNIEVAFYQLKNTLL